MQEGNDGGGVHGCGCVELVCGEFGVVHFGGAEVVDLDIIGKEKMEDI